jgi:hypothetical protein
MITVQINIEPVDIGTLYEPESVPFSFEAPGWYFVFALVAAVLTFAFIRWYKNYQRNSYRREALKNLDIIEKHFDSQSDDQCLTDVMVLLKLVAIKAYGRKPVANLYGDQWLQFLESKGKQTAFTNYGNTILNAVYGTNEAGIDETKEIMSLSRKWIRSHA